MDFKCKICNKDTGNFAALHRHLKKEHFTVPREYYPLYFDRRDKFDDELIEFKDIKSYFTTDFNSKYNLLKWISMGGDEVRNYVMELLKRRAADKNTNLIPAHVELKSIFAPCLSDFITIFGGIDNFKAALAQEGLSMKLDTYVPQSQSGELKVYIDTREQTPLNLPNKETRKLIVGDYCPEEPFFCNLFVERKSMNDLAGTLTSGLERFEKEVQRARELGAYLVVITESAFLDAFEYSPRNSFSQRIGGAYLFNKIRRIMTDYDNIQFLFSSTRARSIKIMEQIFRMGEEAKKVDLEFLKDRGEL